MYLASVQAVPVAVMDSFDNRGVFGVSTCCTSCCDGQYFLSVHVVPVAVVDSIDHRGVFGVCTSSASGSGGQY